MALSRGRYGVEWVPRSERKNPSGLKWILLGVGLVALASFTTTTVRRIRRTAVYERSIESVVPATTNASPETAEAAEPLPPPVIAPAVARAVTEKRPVRVRNLLLRLEEAERRRDIEMAISTIEQLRALPGSPAADLDDALARRLGVLNMRRLFVKKTPLWVDRIEVRRGDSATRIASENGSTFASFARLNDGNVEKVRLGAKVYVMRHPRFTLVVHRRARTADLLLKEKFFKRYDLQTEPTGAAGSYELPKGTLPYLKSLGISLKMADQTELELLLPVGTTILVSDM